MTVSPFPLLRVTLEGLRQETLHALGMQHQEIEKALAEETKRLIETFDFAKAVRETLEPILKQAIAKELENHFRYGPGRTMVEEGVRKALSGEKAER